MNDPEPEACENLCSEELEEKGLGTELNLKADTESTAGFASTANNANDKLDEIVLCVKDIHISVKQSGEKARKKHILPPIAKPDDLSLPDSSIKQMQLARSLNNINDKFTELQERHQPEFRFVTCEDR